MPSVKEHIKSSFKRTGNSYKELHEWIDEEYKNSTKHKRQDIINIPQTIKIVREKFGEEAVAEFLHHIKDDFNTPLLQRIIRKLRQFI